MFPSIPPLDYGASMRAEFERREALRENRLQDTLAAIHEPSTRSPEEAAELKARLKRLEDQSGIQPQPVNLD